MDQQQRIVTLTINPAVDASAAVEHVLADRKLRCTAPKREPGGGGINVSRAVQRLGGAASAVYPAGGAPGQLLGDLLDAEDLHHHPVEAEQWTRENLTVLEESSGQQFRFGMPGAALQREEWEACAAAVIDHVAAGSYVVASGSLPPGVPDDFYAELAQQLPDDVRLVVDTSGSALRHAAEAGVHLLKPNLRELADLAGQPLETEQSQQQAAADLVGSGQADVVLLSLGGAGALLVGPEGVDRFRAPTVPIRSRVGAGDSTVAGMVLALARGKALREAAAYGVAAGAAAVMTPGTELCRKEDADRLVEAILG